MQPSEEYDDQLIRKMEKEIRVFNKIRVVMELTTGYRWSWGGEKENKVSCL